MATAGRDAATAAAKKPAGAKAANPNEWFVKLVEDAQRKYQEANEYVGDIINSIEFKDDAGQETRRGADWKNQHYMPKRSRSCCDFVVPEEEETYDRVQPNRFLSVAYEDAPKYGTGKGGGRIEYSEDFKRQLKVLPGGYAYPGHNTTRPMPQDYLDEQEGRIFPAPPSYPQSGDGQSSQPPARRRPAGKEQQDAAEPPPQADGSVVGDLAEMLS